MEKEKAKKNGKKRWIPIVGVGFILAMLFLVSYLVTMFTESNAFFRDASARAAIVKFEDKIDRANELADEHYDRLYTMAEDLKYADSKEKVVEYLAQYVGSDDFGTLRFYAQGSAYDVMGAKVEKETYGDAEISALVQTNKQGCTPVYEDEQNGFECMAFFAPVRGSQYVDGVLSVLKVHVWAESNADKNIPIVDTDTILKEAKEEDKLLAAIVVNEKGIVYSASTSSALEERVGNDLRKFIRRLTTDNRAEIDMDKAVKSKETSVCHVESVKGDYVLTVAPIEALGGELSLVTITERDDLIAPEMKYLRYIISLTVVAIAALAVGMIYAFFYYRNSRHALEYASNTDPVVGCANAESFRKSADRLLQSRQRNYAMLVFEVRQYEYLLEVLPQGEMPQVLKFVAKVMETFCNQNETYGYLGDGKFGLLMYYVREKSIRDRSRLIETVLSKNGMLGEQKMSRLFNVGAALLMQGRFTAQELIQQATVACQTAKSNVNLPFVIYNEEVKSQRAHNNRIELEMESALANNEFRLFLQPKYNVATDRIDSAEALVRWFDTKTGDYRFPGEFINLFESNGFIVKLDHFMYVEVLKYLQTAVERGEKQVPISVNVSLVTANENDFLNFYIENKKKYGIADDFITIEFTESFLMEDHQKLQMIVERLHRNGIRCSVDDFGTGYASFSLLKDVSFDELKLDRTLLSTGQNQKQDEMIMGSIIQLAKSLGMVVVQEGVETKAMFDRAVESGCSVIQGYYYAKAIPVEEYKLFLNSNTSIKYKSLVK